MVYIAAALFVVSASALIVFAKRHRDYAKISKRGKARFRGYMVAFSVLTALLFLAAGALGIAAISKARGEAEASPQAGPPTQSFERPDELAEPAKERDLGELTIRYAPVFTELERLALESLPEEYKNEYTYARADFHDADAIVRGDADVSFCVELLYVDFSGADEGDIERVMEPVFARVLTESDYPISELTCYAYCGEEPVSMVSYAAQGESPGG